MRERIAAIRAAAERVGATLWFVDEAGVRSDCHEGTRWVPVGKTPVVTITGARCSVNLVSAVPAKGTPPFAAYQGSLTAERLTR